MILAIDIGNTNITLGIFEKNELIEGDSGVMASGIFGFTILFSFLNTKKEKI